MTVERMIGKILRCYGRRIFLHRGTEKIEIFGFFEPDTGKMDRMTQLHPGPLGLENRNRYIYIGPPEMPVQLSDELEMDGKHYLVRSIQTVYGTKKPAYIWAMCIEKGVDIVWAKNG